MVDSRCLQADTKNVICISGGKDSLAMWLMAIEAGVDFVPVFADTGHEHPVTLDYLEYLESRLGTVQRVKADFSARIEGKRQFIRERWPVTLVSECGLSTEIAARTIQIALDTLKPTGVPFLDLCMLKGRFPSTKARFCTTDLKNIPVREQVVEPLLNKYDEVVTWHGVRAQESPARALLAAWDEDADDTRGLHVYRPILQWTFQDVFAMAARHGIEPNPLYKQGCSRVGCMPCINVNKAELREIFSRWPEEIERVAQWEQLVAACSRRQNSTFFPSFHDPKNTQRCSSLVTIESHGIAVYRDWAFTTRGGSQFDLLADEPDKKACHSVYAGVCE